MWHLLEKISEQVTRYATFLGQLWYILVFVFRLIVVVTIGGAVYGDEQSAFKCSTDVVGCQHICYNEFAKVSHMRFWAFQLLAVATPTVFFHFYSLYVSGEIQKIKNEEERLRQLEEGEHEPLMGSEREFRKMSRRKKSVGHVKVRKIMSGNELKEIPYTNKIHYAYFVSIIFRLVAEGVFIYIGYILFKEMVPLDPTCKAHPESALCSNNGLYFLWMKVPAFYKCTGEKGSDVFHACTMHISQGGYVPCFVSRPFEKTVFLCYMSMLSGICFLLSALELVVVIMRRFYKNRPNKHRHLFRGNSHRHPQHQRNGSVFYGPTPTAPKYLEDDPGNLGFYPSLAVPVRIATKYPHMTNMNNHHQEKKVQINDEERDSDHNEKENMSETASVKSYV